MENLSPQHENSPAPDRTHWHMKPIFRSKKNVLTNFLRTLLLLSVVGMGIFIYFNKKKNNAEIAQSTLPPDEFIPETSSKSSEALPLDTLLVDEPSVAPSTFAELAHDLMKKNRPPALTAQHPFRSGIAAFQNGNFTKAATIFEIILDSSENENIAAAADYYLLLALLADRPRTDSAYQTQLDRLLEQKNHTMYQKAGIVKWAASKIQR